MPAIDEDKPFPLIANLVLADQRGDYERAAHAQRRLAELGWYVSRQPPAQTKRTRGGPRRNSVGTEAGS
jgi:hypothetical protein